MLCTQGNCQSTGYLHSRDLVSCACIKVSTLNHKPSGENTSKLRRERRRQKIKIFSSPQHLRTAHHQPSWEVSSVSILEEQEQVMVSREVRLRYLVFTSSHCWSQPSHLNTYRTASIAKYSKYSTEHRAHLHSTNTIQHNECLVDK